jgi:hypothetical protein
MAKTGNQRQFIPMPDGNAAWDTPGLFYTNQG